MGMLPLIANDLDVSIPAAELLVSLIGLIGVFTVGNLMSAIAGTYAILMAPRVITSFNHGAFFGVGAVVAAGVMPPKKRSAAVATMFSGVAIATIGGVPLAAWVGQVYGWRSAFWGIAAIGG